MLKYIEDGWCAIDKNIIFLNTSTSEYWINDDLFYLTLYNRVRFAGHPEIIFYMDKHREVQTRVQIMIDKLVHTYGIPSRLVISNPEILEVLPSILSDTVSIKDEFKIEEIKSDAIQSKEETKLRKKK
jgi:hypothetical protein